MIHLECPGCAATFSVTPDHAGKTGKCPTCATQFTIPAADAPPEAPTQPATPEPADAAEPVEVQPCPGCQARVAVARTDLGTNVECPHCTTRFVAVSPTESRRSVSRGGRDRRSARRRDEADDEFDDRDDRPRRRRAPSGDGDSQVGTLGTLLVVGGVLAIVWTVGMIFSLGVATCGICCFWPGLYLGPIWGVLAIVRGVSMTNGRDSRPAPPTALQILQVCLILNLDVINMTLGIVGLVMANHGPTRDYYAGNSARSDD